MSTVATPPVERKPEIKEEAGAALISRGVRARPLFDPEILKRAIRESFVKLNPRLVMKNPVMFVVEVGAALTTIFVVKDAIERAGGVFFRRSDRLVAVVHGAVRQLRGSHGGSPRQSASGFAAQDQDRHHRAAAFAEREV